MRLGHVELFVRDPMQSRAFYEDVLGFNVVAVQDERFVWVEKGAVELLLRPGAPPAGRDDYAGSGTALVLYTDDLPGEVRALSERGLNFAGCDGSDACPTFRDPDGNWFMLVDPANH
jgi:catechol 2,3-dioxygenase-like lactoylglutathione lyase family enzyme